MDKKQVIDYLWKYYDDSLSTEDYVDIFTNYSKDYGKGDESVLQEFLFLISASGLIFTLVKEALTKYRRDLGIIEVYQPKINGRKIINIY